MRTNGARPARHGRSRRRACCVAALACLVHLAVATNIEIKAGVDGGGNGFSDEQIVAFWDAASACFGGAATTSSTAFSTTAKTASLAKLDVDTADLGTADWDRLCRCMRSEVSEAGIVLTGATLHEGNSHNAFHEWAAPSRPNIVFVLADDLGWADVGWHEYETRGLESATPFLDTLVPDGVRLERMYTAATCSPSRAQLWTGRYFYRSGHGPAVTSGGLYGLSGRETTLAEILKGNGYHTAIIGKWHLGYQDERFWPTFRGFDNHIGPFSLDHTSRLKTKSLIGFNQAFDFTQSKIRKMVTLHNASIKLDQLSFADELPPVYTESGAPAAYDNMHGTDIIASEAERYVHVYYASEARAKPLFLNVAFRAPHTPLNAPARYAKDADLKHLFSKAGSDARLTYLRMVHAVDAAIARTVGALHEEYVWHDTVFIFSSDNGGMSTPAAGASNYPLNGQKNNVWEGGTRVATLVLGTESSLAPLAADVRGGTNEEYMHFVDLLPTIATGIAGIAPSAYANAWKCSTCLAHNDNKLDGANRWDSISTGAAIDPVMRVVAVVTEEQVDLWEDLATLRNFVPRAVWDPSVYYGTDLGRYIVRGSEDDFSWTEFQSQVRLHGGGALMYGPYKLVFGFPSPGKSSFPWEMITSTYRTKYNSSPNNGGQEIDFALDGAFPRGHDNVVYLFNLDDDPTEKKNLLGEKFRTTEIEALVRKMITFYKATQQAGEAVTDNYLRMGFTDDLAELVDGLEFLIHFKPFCSRSKRCLYDLNVTQGGSSTSPELSLAPTAAPTEETVPSATPRPTQSPTPAPTEDSMPVLTSSDQEAADSLSKLKNKKGFPSSCTAYLYNDAALAPSASSFLIKRKTMKKPLKKWTRYCWNLCAAHSETCTAFAIEKVSRRRVACSIYSARSAVVSGRVDKEDAHVAVLSDACFTP